MPDALRKSQPAPLGEENKSVTFFFKGRNKYGVPLFLLFLSPYSPRCVSRSRLHWEKKINLSPFSLKGEISMVSPYSPLFVVPLFVVVNCFLQHNPCLQGAGLFRLTNSHYV